MRRPPVRPPRRQQPAPERGLLAPEALLRLDEGERLLSKPEADALVQRIYALAQGGGWTMVQFANSWHGELSWARNRVSLASDRRTVELSVQRSIGGVHSTVSTNQLDATSLEAVVRQAERQALIDGERDGLPGYGAPTPDLPTPAMQIWSAATSALSAEAAAGVAQAVIGPAEEKGLLSAGALEVHAMAFTRQHDWDRWNQATDYLQYGSDQVRRWGQVPRPAPYTPYTTAECAMTVRDQHGTGSGWAGLTSFDWSAIDTTALGARALEKCLASRNPVALEPGRYTVILEPQAVEGILTHLMLPKGPPEFDRMSLEGGASGHPFYRDYEPTLGIYRSKLGLKVADERVTLGYDPADPRLGIFPTPGLAPITWITNGVLTDLGYSRQYALEQFRENTPALGAPMGYRMSGGATTLEEMIQSTKRGLLVSRFDQVQPVRDPVSVLCTGLTRDGLWLIENGQISKPVKNMRFTESVMVVLNNLEQLGVPVPVFRQVGGSTALSPAIVPPLKVRDFSFTGVVDAV